MFQKESVTPVLLQITPLYTEASKTRLKKSYNSVIRICVHNIHLHFSSALQLSADLSSGICLVVLMLTFRHKTFVKHIQYLAAWWHKTSRPHLERFIVYCHKVTSLCFCGYISLYLITYENISRNSMWLQTALCNIQFWE